MLLPTSAGLTSRKPTGSVSWSLKKLQKVRPLRVFVRRQTLSSESQITSSKCKRCLRLRSSSAWQVAPSSSPKHHRIRSRPLFWYSRVSRTCIGRCYRRHRFRGLAHTKPAVIKRTLSLKVGEPFSCEKWQRDHAALIDLDLFASIEARFAAPRDRIPSS